MVAMSKMVDLVCPASIRGKVYQDDAERESQFPAEIVLGNILEVLRVSLTNKQHLLGCHEDNKNDNHQLYRGVINY
jgi:hypothetical protein